MCLPIGGSSALYQNQKLHNSLLLAGGALVITGIALSCINHPAAFALGSVSLSIGTPILLIGLFMTIVRKSMNDRSSSEQRQQTRTRTRGEEPAYEGSTKKLGGTRPSSRLVEKPS